MLAVFGLVGLLNMAAFVATIALAIDMRCKSERASITHYRWNAATSH